MVNNYNLEAELLKKSKITSRSPKTLSNSAISHVYDLDNCQCGCKKTDQ